MQITSSPGAERTPEIQRIYNVWHLESGWTRVRRPQEVRGSFHGNRRLLYIYINNAALVASTV
jgi:hypothetical protein